MAMYIDYSEYEHMGALEHGSQRSRKTKRREPLWLPYLSGQQMVFISSFLDLAIRFTQETGVSLRMSTFSIVYTRAQRLHGTRRQ